MRPVCCGCNKEVSTENAKNILNDDLVIESSDFVDVAEPIVGTKIIKLCDGIKLLTGYKVSKAEDSAVLCTTCCQKVESFMIFRTQLLTTFEKLFERSDSKKIFKSIPDSEPVQCYDLKKNNWNMYKITDITTNEIIDSYKLLEPKVTVDDATSGEDNNILLELNNSLNDESETNDSSGSTKLQTDQENNQFNDSDNSNEVQDINDSKEVFSKVQEDDIESEVNVHSGEYDEVLELDIRCSKDDIVNETSSSESDTEDYDYEPIRKKIRNYNALSISDPDGCKVL